ncbi:MAG TPA: beta-N-acetylhexosaminidase [Gemmatimonadaceae bacterium]|nr:beta-N-acetylhexosaminidase [Gemmatimonadaceae bacterium]
MSLPRPHRALLGAAVTLACTAAACRPAPAQAPAPRPREIQTPPVLASLAEHRVIPAPTSVTPADGAPFALAATTTIVVRAADSLAARVGEALAALLRPATGFALPVSAASGPAPRGAIALRLGGAAALGEEGYELTITADSVRLVAARAAGLFRGVQTLRQLLPAGIEAEQSAMRMASAWTVPAGRISDRPRFAWRGGMLDVARHFFTVDEVQQYIDLLALYKLNVLHLHLSDDQGWRIQIDAWPKLATVGGSTQVGGGPGGFYTKADYAEIVRYAGERFITVVPEIDMPGHTNAAIAAYPELGCSRPTPAVNGGTPGDSQPPGVYTGIRVGWSTLCHDRDVTYRFVDDVLRELAEMTPGPYLHVGGDEVEALTREQYAHFIERVQDIVQAHGKTMVGWEEVGKARLRPTSIAQLWRGDTALLAQRQGAKLILSPGPKAYLDMKYTPATELGLRWAGFIELRTAYDWDPASHLAGVPETSIVGVEAPLWTEAVENLTAAHYLLVPRLPALAEVGWSAAPARDWERFRARIAAHAPRWRLLGVNYYPSPQVDW